MSTKEFGCFFCEGKSSDYDGKCDTCGASINIGKELLHKTIDEYTLQSIIGRGFYGWTVKVQDKVKQSFIIKLIPIKRYHGKEPLNENEVQALVKCSPHRNLVRFWRPLNKVTLKMQNRETEVFGLVFDFIENAVPLSEMLESTEFKPTKVDIVDILSGIASGLARMHFNNLWHDDLHDDNILIRKVEDDENLTELYEAKIIDFGSTTPRILGEPEHGSRSDYEYLCKHIYNLIAHFEKVNYTTITPSDRAFAKNMRRIGQQIGDPDVSRRDLQPHAIISQIRDALDDTKIGSDYLSFEEMKKQTAVSLNEPLSNTNALSLKPQDICILFRDSLHWEERIEKSEPVLIVGPRGSGKTMLLRYLSISSQARPQKNETSHSHVARRLDSLKYVGFLVNSGQLRTPFFRSAYKKLVAMDSGLAEDFCREYINAHFAFEVIRTIAWLKSENLAHIEDNDIQPLLPAANYLLGISKEKNTIDDVIVSLDQRIVELSNLSAVDQYRPTNLCGDNALFQLSRIFKSLPWAKSKEAWFLLDDYSPTVFPDLAIKAYNPVLFRLSSEVKIKISSEGNGPRFEDTMERKYKEGRELTKVNLGEIYFQTAEKQCIEFFEQILKARFEATKKGSLTELKKMLTEHKHDAGFGKYICSIDRPGDARFYGFNLICRLCSGDVSYIIELLHSLTSGHWSTAKPLSPKYQDDVIKRFSQRQLADLKATSQYGPKLHMFAEKLGNLLKGYLIKSKDKENADERLRIEIEGTGELSSEAQLIENELFKHSVLIYGGAGKSKKGLPTRKLFFRRLFAPCFPFSPALGDCIPLNVQQYEQWLLKPETIWSVAPNDDELPLFNKGDK